jgi:hypothetical protein
MLESPLLEPEQEELLVILVEATRNLPPGQREQFMFLPTLGDQNDLCHPGLPGGAVSAYDGDLDVLSNAGLINRKWGGKGGDWFFDVAPRGFKVYEAIKLRTGAPVQQIEEELTRYLDAGAFQKRYLGAYRKWSEAAEKLWSSASEQQLTTIGHLCREAIQEFATALVEKHRPQGVDQDKAHDINRVAAVLEQHKAKLGTKGSDFLGALLGYWATVSGLVQRQEHGGQKQDRPLIWEDGRRIVFQTAIVMFEIDRALERGSSAQP